MKNKEQKKVNFVIDKELLTLLQQYAEENERSISQSIRIILTKVLNNKEGNDYK